MREPRCSHPEVLADTFACRWPAGTEVTWYLDAASAPWFETGPAVATLAIRAGMDPWRLASGVTTRQVLDPAEARVLIRFAPIDGPWNVLGQTELPCDGRSDARHLMTLDWSEAWTPEWLGQVVMHEFGHALGLGHAPAGTRAVMSPIYDPGLTSLQPWDVDQAVARYGPPAAPAPAAPGIPPPPVTFGSSFAVAAAGPLNLTFEPVSIDFPSAGNYEVRVTVTRVD